MKSSAWFDALRALVFPRLCVSCDLPVDRFGGLCGPCHRQLEKAGENHCEICGQSFDGAFSNAFRCANCADRSFAFDFAVAPYRSTGLVRRMVHDLKYEKRLHLVPILGQLASEALDDPRLGLDGAVGTGRSSRGLEGETHGGETHGGETHGGETDADPWILVPVPLHRRRRRAREFNQSREIAAQVAKLSGFPMVDALIRTRYTSTQTRLARSERMKNLRGAFSVRQGKRGRLVGARVLLVDDILTTGTTAHECARVLRVDSRVEKVVVVTVARG